MKKTKQPTTLGGRLQHLRIQAGQVQRDVAIKLGVETGTVSRWELDKSRPHSDQLDALALHFGVSIEYLMRGTEGAPVMVAPPPELAEFLASRDGRAMRDRGLEPLLLQMARHAPKPLAKRQWRHIAHILMEDETE